MSFKDYKNNRKNAFENLQKQLKNVNEGSSYKSEDDDKYWKIGKDAAGNGFAIIRFLPGIGDSGNDFVKTFSYGFQGPTGKWYIEESPNTIGKDDPVGVANSKLWNSGIESNKEIARKRKRRTKFVASIYVIKDRENPSNEGKVFWYAHPKTIYDMYNDLMYPEGAEDDESIVPINPFDMYEGANFRLSVRKNDQGWPDYGKSKFENQSTFLSSDEEREAVYNSIYNLDELLDEKRFKSYEELEKKFKEVMAENTDDEGSANEHYKEEPSESKREEPKEQRKSYESAGPEKDFSPDEDDDGEDALAVFRKMKR